MFPRFFTSLITFIPWLSFSVDKQQMEDLGEKERLSWKVSWDPVTLIHCQSRLLEERPTPLFEENFSLRVNKNFKSFLLLFHVH